MTRATVAILLTVLLACPALAAPGDPRFVQGTLEWPATLTREPVIVVRGDDGQAYYCDVTDAARHGADGLRSGARVAVLGVEGAKPHEVTGIVIGTGDAAALARALSQSLATPAATAPAPASAATAVPAGAPAASAPPAPAAPPAAAGPPAAAAPPAAVAPPAASAPPAAPAPAAASPARPPAGTPDQPAATSPAAPAATPGPAAAGPAVIIMTPSTNVTAAPPPGAAAIVKATAGTPAVAATAPPPPRAIAPATRESRGQWKRLDGVVQAVVGSTLTLRTDDGGLAHVDIAQLSPNVRQVLRQGTAVTVYGYPLEQRFEAAGYVQPHASGPEPRAAATTAR